jgi:hypothetical protein
MSNYAGSEMKPLLNELARAIMATLPPNHGFTLFLFGYGEDKPLYYISSAVRSDMVGTLKEFLIKQGETSLF